MDCDLHAGGEKMEKNKHRLEIEFFIIWICLMFIISIILVALPLKRHRGFKFQAPITPQMFFVPENIPNCLQIGNIFRKKPFFAAFISVIIGSRNDAES